MFWKIISNEFQTTEICSKKPNVVLIDEKSLKVGSMRKETIAGCIRSRNDWVSLRARQKHTCSENWFQALVPFKIWWTSMSPNTRYFSKKFSKSARSLIGANSNFFWSFLKIAIQLMSQNRILKATKRHLQLFTIHSDTLSYFEAACFWDNFREILWSNFCKRSSNS